MKFQEAMDHLFRSHIPPFVYLFACDGDRNYFKRVVVRRPFVDERINGQGAKNLPIQAVFTCRL